MAKNYYDITLALAGICQSARLAQQLAHDGRCDDTALAVSLKSILVTHPPSTLAVYGGEEPALTMGMETLLCVLNTQHKGAGAELTRYTLSLMVLERKLQANKGAMDALADRITQLDRQLAHFDLTSETMFGSLAAIYVDIISTLGPRIQVTGSASMLQNSLIQDKIRASLLAGIRAAVLWQQVGGGRLQLMFCRQQLLKQARLILAEINELKECQ